MDSFAVGCAGDMAAGSADGGMADRGACSWILLTPVKGVATGSGIFSKLPIAAEYADRAQARLVHSVDVGRQPNRANRRASSAGTEFGTLARFVGKTDRRAVREGDDVSGQRSPWFRHSPGGAAAPVDARSGHLG